MAVVAVAVFSVNVQSAQAQTPVETKVYEWVDAAPFPEPDEETYGAEANGKFYVLGGWGSSGNRPGFNYEYDPATNVWTEKAGMPTAVHHQAQTSYDGKIYVFGGCTTGIAGADGSQFAWEYDPATDAWRTLRNSPIKRCSPLAEVVDGKIYVIGGLEPLENGEGTRVTGLNLMYDPVADTWTERSPMPTTRNHAFSGVVDGKIYVMGGRQAAGRIPVTSNTDVVEVYDPVTDLWGLPKQRMLMVRSGGGWATCGGRIWVGGGEWITRAFHGALRSLDAYDPASDTWQIMPPLPGAVHGNAMACVNNKLHTVTGKMRAGGGQDAPDAATATHHIFELPQ